MRALAGKSPSSGRSGPTPQAGFPPLPEGEGEEAPPRLQLNGKTPRRMLFAPIHKNFDRSSGSALATKATAAWFNSRIFAGDKSGVAGVELATASKPPARQP